MAAETRKCTVAGYLARRIAEMGIRHLFAVPGNFCADFLMEVERIGTISVIGTTNELEAGYAADAYSRLAGFGAACVTHGVGALSLLNATAGSYVERCPVVLINGGPSSREWADELEKGILFLHSTGRFRTDFEMFEKVTEAAAVIDRADDAPAVIDHLLGACMLSRRPVYIEVGLDLWNEECSWPGGPLNLTIPASQPEALREAVCEAANRIQKAENPVLWGGEEIHRFGLQDDFEKLISVSDLPYATTLLGKSIISEDNSRFIGVYDGKFAPKETRQIVEASDCIIALGTTISNFIGDVVARDFANMILAVRNGLRIGYHTYPEIVLGDFLRELTAALAEANFTAPPRPESFQNRRPKLLAEAALVSFNPKQEEELTFDSFFRRIAAYINESMVLMADTSVCLFPSADLLIKRRSGYIAQAVWLSIGFTTGGTVGASFAHSEGPVVTFVGDGGFQMIPQMLSTLARHKRSAVVFLFNNKIYGIEQFLINSEYFKDPSAKPAFFNDLPEWEYNHLANGLGVETFLRVRTNHELEAALAKLGSWSAGPVLIEVVIPAKDLPSGLRQTLVYPSCF
jgi:indolepyruvate decarboxylase